MKKLYISCPTKGRKWDDITKTFDQMHKLAEVVFDQELEVVNTDLGNLEATDMVTLAKHIELMSEADYFVGFNDVPSWDERFRFCMQEMAIASAYNIERYFVDGILFAPDMYTQYIVEPLKPDDQITLL